MNYRTEWFVENLKFMKDRKDLIDMIMKFLEIYPGFIDLTKEELESKSTEDLKKIIWRIRGKFEEVE